MKDTITRENFPFFSVIIPVHNAEKYLKAAVCSVLGQTFSDFEILAVDDASTDSSREQILALAGEDALIRGIFLDQNVGAGEARNIGIRNARGSYLLFLDADDTFSPGLLSRVHASLAEHPAQVVCWGLVEEYRDERQRLVSERVVSCPEMILSGAEEVRGQVLSLEKKGLYGYLWNKAYQTDYLRKREIWIPTQDFNEDEMFNISFFMGVSSMNLLDYTGSHYSKRTDSSLTHRYLPNYYPLAMKRVAGLLAQQMRWGLDTPEVRRELADIYLRYLLSALERNCDRRQSMDYRKRWQFLTKVFRSRLYRELLPYAKPGNPALSALAFFLRHQWAGGALLMGRAVHLVKARGSRMNAEYRCGRSVGYE